MDWNTRREMRVPVESQGLVQVNPLMADTVRLAKKTVEVRLADLNQFGAGVLTPTFLPRQTLLDLEIPRSLLTGFGNGDQGYVRLTAEVMYARPHRRECRLGLSFTWIEQDKDLELLRRLVASHKKPALFAQVPFLPGAHE